jgi:hypothetical protein
MQAITSIYRVDMENSDFIEMQPCEAREIKLKEKRIEEWVATKPKLLFSDADAVMVISQELAGEPQADLLAVDSQGNLIIIEIKRHASDRSTVGQLLDYASCLAEWDYEAFHERYRSYTGRAEADLFGEFKLFVENPVFEKEVFLQQRRLFILSSGGDESMMRIISWLRESYDVPIDYVPFALFRCGEEVFLQMQKIEVDPIVLPGEWAGDWFFNTDEKHKPGAYEKMLAQSVIADFGYGHAKSKHKMDLPAQGERVFAYVNTIGIIAVGQVVGEESRSADTVFNRTDGDEYHREVEWKAVVDLTDAVTPQEATEWGYNLPIRCTIGKMGNGRVAGIVARELHKRSK